MKISGTENNETILKELGQRIKDIRIKMSMTQKEFALKAGVSARTIERLENGENINIECFLNVLRVINCIQNTDLLITEQILTPEMIFNNQKKRQRASAKQKKEEKIFWKWGDEQ